MIRWLLAILVIVVAPSVYAVADNGDDWDSLGKIARDAVARKEATQEGGVKSCYEIIGAAVEIGKKDRKSATKASEAIPAARYLLKGIATGFGDLYRDQAQCDRASGNDIKSTAESCFNGPCENPTNATTVCSKDLTRSLDAFMSHNEIIDCIRFMHQ